MADKKRVYAPIRFNTILASWAFTWDEVQPSPAAWVFDNAPTGSGLCLDLGCGDGRHRSWVEATGLKYFGFDLDVTRGGASVACDALHLCLADESLDMVLLWQVLEHLPQPWTAMSEIIRVLKPGGSLVGSVSCMEPFHDVCSYLGFTHKGLEQVLTDCGFVNIQIKPGINAITLITRNWFIHLLGGKYGERIAFVSVKVFFKLTLLACLIVRKFWAWLRGGKERAASYKNTSIWLKKDAPLEYAGHLLFRADKAK